MAADGFAFCRSAINAIRLSLSALTSKLALPIVQWTMPALSSDIGLGPPWRSYRAGHVRRHGTDLRIRHEPARTKNLAQLPTTRIASGLAITTSKLICPALHLLGEVLEPDDVGPRRLRGVLILAGR